MLTAHEERRSPGANISIHNQEEIAHLVRKLTTKLTTLSGQQSLPNPFMGTDDPRADNPLADPRSDQFDSPHWARLLAQTQSRCLFAAPQCSR